MEQPTAAQRTQGIVAAVIAYIAWGFLSPGGKLLLEHAGVWTINFHRTWLSLLIFLVIFGRPRSARALGALSRDWRLWVLGVVGLGSTFVLYLYSVDRLAPTVATVLLYLSPVAVAWTAQRFLGEAREVWAIPVAFITLGGVALAVFEPLSGGTLEVGEGIGLAVGVLSVAFWTFYTLYLRHLAGSYGEGTLTIASFAASGLFFLVGSLAVERLAFDVNRESLLLLAAYVAFPSVISFLLYAVAVRRAGAAIASVLIGIELLSTAVFSWFLVDERLSIDKLIGYAIVLAAVTAFIASQRRKVPEAAA